MIIFSFLQQLAEKLNKTGICLVFTAARPDIRVSWLSFDTADRRNSGENCDWASFAAARRDNRENWLSFDTVDRRDRGENCDWVSFIAARRDSGKNCCWGLFFSNSPMKRTKLWLSFFATVFGDRETDFAFFFYFSFFFSYLFFNPLTLHALSSANIIEIVTWKMKRREHFFHKKWRHLEFHCGYTENVISFSGVWTYCFQYRDVEPC